MRPLTATIATAGVLLSTLGAPAATAEAAQPRCSGASFMQSGRTVWVQVPTEGANDRDISCVLAYGDRTTGVRVLQRTLNRCYGFRLAEDAIYGARTRAAVERVQGWIGARTDGIYGPETSTLMQHYSTARSCAQH